MSLGILSQIGMHEPWAIHPEYAQTYYPLLAALLRGENPKQEDTDYSLLRQLNKPFYFSSDEDLDDEEFDPNTNNDLSQAPEGAVAVVRLNGPVIKYSQFCGPRGTVDIAADLKRIESNPNFVGVVFQIESGGGQVYAIKPITDVMDSMKKPIVVLAGNYLASAAYAIGIHGREIVADHPKSIVGSIGTMMSFQDVQPYFESLGVKFHEVYASKSTLKNKRMRDALKGDYKSLISDMLDPINEDFIADVQKQRKGLSTNKAILAGETFFASVSKELGMIDHLGDMTFAVQRVRELAKAKPSKSKPDQSTQAQSEILENMTFPNLQALVGVANPTQEQINLAMQDLTNANITGATLVDRSFAATAATNATEVTRLTGELATANQNLTAKTTDLATATTAKETAEASLATANTKVTELEAKVEAFGKNAGAINQQSTGDDTPPAGQEDDMEAILAAMPHNRAADNLFK